MRVDDAPLDAVANPAKGGVVVHRTWQKHVLTFLMVFGPGLIVMEADNDAGAVSTYMQAGGQYGLHLLWLLGGAAAHLLLRAGNGGPARHRDRQRSRRHDLRTLRQLVGTLLALRSAAVNFLTLVTEFAAISLALSAMGISPYISVPVAAVGLTLMVVTGSYLRWERIVIALCLMDLTWFGWPSWCIPTGRRCPQHQSCRRCQRAASPAASSF